MPQYLPSIAEDVVEFMRELNEPVSRDDIVALFAAHSGYEIDFTLLGGVQTVDEILAASADVRWSEERQTFSVSEVRRRICLVFHC